MMKNYDSLIRWGLNELSLMKSGSISSLKVAVIMVFAATPVAPAAGALSVTLGKVVSGVKPVVNVQTASLAAGNKDTSPAKRLPAKSLTSVLTNTVNKVLGGKVKGLEGIKVAVFAPTA